ATCAVLLDDRSRADPGAPAAPIDPHSTSTAVLHGTLVGPSGTKVSAVDLRTGALLWTSDVAAGSQDAYALRDGLLAIEAGELDVLAFHVRLPDSGSWHFDEIVLGLDPRTGAERWRKTVARHPRGATLHQDGTLRLAGDAQRVYVRSN